MKDAFRRCIFSPSGVVIARPAIDDREQLFRRGRLQLQRLFAGAIKPYVTCRSVGQYDRHRFTVNRLHQFVRLRREKREQAMLTFDGRFFRPTRADPTAPEASEEKKRVVCTPETVPV